MSEEAGAWEREISNETGTGAYNRKRSNKDKNINLVCVAITPFSY